MRFTPLPIDGAWLIELEPFVDSRGTFARTFCAREFAEHGLADRYVQHSRSLSDKQGALRGLHLQHSPYAEAKLIACIRGAIFDVCVDVRPQSPTFRSWYGVELTHDNGRQLYIPEGCAHGFQTLVDSAEIHYMMSNYYAPDAAMGYRWNDPAFDIDWPLVPTAISDKDQAWPLMDG